MALPDYLLPEAANETPPVLSNNAFYPDIDVNAFVAQCLVNQTHSQDRIIKKLQRAIILTNKVLTEQKAKWQDAGNNALSEVEQDWTGDELELVLVYTQAVYAKAMELLSERYRATDTTEYAVEKAKNMEKTAQNYADEYRQALIFLTTDRELEQAHEMTSELI